MQVHFFADLRFCAFYWYQILLLRAIRAVRMHRDANNVRYVQECLGLSQDVPGYHMHLYICIQYYTYHLPCSLRREPSLLPIKRGWSLTMHSAPPPLLMGRGCGCSSDRGHRTSRDNPWQSQTYTLIQIFASIKFCSANLPKYQTLVPAKIVSLR